MFQSGSAHRGEITQLLDRASAGEAQATDALLPLVYDELCRLAAQCLGSERRSHTLEATALVHEAYLRLVGAEDVSWECRAHFFGAAARAIRRILIDHARARMCSKRGGGRGALSVNESMPAVNNGTESVDVLALDQALSELAELDAQKARIVELRFFGGLSAEDTARSLGISVRSVARAWEFARVWLHARLESRNAQ